MVKCLEVGELPICAYTDLSWLASYGVNWPFCNVKCFYETNSLGLPIMFLWLAAFLPNELENWKLGSFFQIALSGCLGSRLTHR
jgi:hypothetical protein